MKLTSLTPGMPIVWGGDQVTHISEELAAAFTAGDRLVVVQDTGDLLHIPGAVWKVSAAAVEAATAAFVALRSVPDDAVSAFYEAFADLLEDDASFGPIAEANTADVTSAAARGRTTTRLELTPRMRADMIAGLRAWASTPSIRGHITQTIEHEGWRLDQVLAGVGPVGFVFEGRPNVFADATGVLRSGNSVVFRIGSDALGTARAIVTHALDPALAASGLPPGAVSLVDSAERSAGWAMFSMSDLALAVARGSGRAVSQLGAVARQAGIPVSLHGTGGAWIVADTDADPTRFRAAVVNSLDRKVCNTLNTCCVTEAAAANLVPLFLEALEEAGRLRDASAKLWVVEQHSDIIPPTWFDEVGISRAEGIVREPRTSTLGWEDLGKEWEWEDSPEVTLAIVKDTDHAIELFNALSPRFAASLISVDPNRVDRFFDAIDSPFVGDGFTRWVDGQFALDKPELGLSNWQFGRLFGRGGILSGDSVFTVRSRATQYDEDLRR
jgi:glutamate-5-semialdehyde dehydrogenase